ncbi:MAG TPA: SHOCT domain-containing protein [Bacteroidia bacterium]|nr:SHOCT domain-containing protein [Bacteroidia bacterium]
MKHTLSIRLTCLLLACSILFASCSSSTLLQSTPPGADIYADQQKLGVTPYVYTDSKIVGSTTMFTLKKDGYQDLNVTLTRNEQADVGAIIGGLFVLVPFLWVCKYNPQHNYMLTPGSGVASPMTSTQNAPMVTSTPQSSDQSAAELGKIKGLFDNGTITQDEYDKLKGMILDNKYNYSNSPADQISKLKSWLDQKLITQDDFAAKKTKVINGQ